MFSDCSAVSRYSDVKCFGGGFFMDTSCGKGRVFGGHIDKGPYSGKNPLVKKLYQIPENPAFEIFHLSEAHAVIRDFSGNPPVEIDL